MLSLSDLVYSNDPSTAILLAKYNWSIVALSILTAMVTSVMALQLARVAQSQRSNLSQQGTIFSGAICLGAGIWAMHFIGMMALEICTQVSYDPTTTILSMLPAVLASWYSLRLLTSEVDGLYALVRGGTVVGAGIGIMHYSGMMALQMKPMMQFRMEWVGASVLVAVSLATLALWVGSKFSRYNGLRSILSIVAGGSLMGLAISAMHYTGMIASVFIGEEDLNFDASENLSTVFALGVATVTLLIAILAFSINALVRYRKMMADIQASERHLSAVLNTTKDSILTFDHQGNIQTFNEASLQMFAYDRDTFTKLNIEQLIVATTYQDKVKLSNFYNNTNTVIELDQVYGIKNGKAQFPIRISFGDVEIDGQKAFIVYITDLTQQKQLESAAKEKDFQLQSLMGNIPGVAFRMQVNESGSHSPILLSSSVKALTGFAAKKYLSDTSDIRNHILTDDRERVIDTINHQASLGDDYHIEYRILDKYGKERWVSEYGSGHIEPDSKRLVIDGVMVDISEEKLKNAAYESIVKAIHRSTCIAEYSTEGIILDANQKFLDVMGFEREEVIGQHHAIFCPKDFAHSDAYKQKWLSLNAGNYVDGDYLRFGKNNKEVWIHASYNPLFDADGKVVKVLLFMIDISERVLMEKALVDAKEKAESAAIAKATFLANMSHEIRTPMNAVIGYSDVMMDTSLDSTQQNYLKTIQHSAKSLLHLLNDILDSAKLENGKLDFEEVNFHLDHLLDSVISTLWIQARKKELELELKIRPEASGFYLGAESRIRQVLMNLTGNAIKFTEQGKVSIEVSKPKGNTLEIAITDTGIGIPEDRLGAIFDPFTQADTSTSRRFGGTGLGTTISKQFIEAMGGTITAQSTLGVGTCFTIYLPLEQGTNIPVQSANENIALPPLKVLIADDIKQNRELLTLLLERDGHRVSTATNGIEVLEAFNRQVFDLLVLDVQMPEMDGLTAAQSIIEIETSKAVQHTPIIALTASVLNEDREAAQAAGMDGFATKPIDIDAFYAEASRVLGFDQPKPVTKASGSNAANQTALPSIDLDAGVRRWNDQLYYQKELNRYGETISALKIELNRLLDDKDREQFKFFAHTQKGIAGNLSLKKLQALFNTLENKLNQEDSDQIKASVKSIDAELTTVELEINQLFPKEQLGNVASLSDDYNDELSKIVSLLMEKAQRAEIDDELLTLLFNRATTPFKESTLEIQRSFNEFEFQKSEALLIKLAQALAS